MHQSNALATVDSRRAENKVWLIHQRLGHPSFQILKQMFPDEFEGSQIEHFLCDVFEKAKHKRHSYQSEKIERKKLPFQLIHSDVWGPAPSTDIHGFRWFLVFVDDSSRFSKIDLLKQKSKVTKKIKQVVQMIDRKFEKRLKLSRQTMLKIF